ncbi:MAG: carbonic anhydrase [Pedobacter sp.]|nr:MAG: carbonic anhydrase [Pedobacter sp.]
MKKLLDGNKQYVRTKLETNPEYFKELAKGQSPEYLWIGCSDSRIPANEVTGTRSGEIFVHRNIANMVVHTDINMLSVLQYAVDVLKVKHVIVCGHYGCGGVLAALSNQSYGLIDNWLRNIKDVYRTHRDELDLMSDNDKKARRLVELNVIEQVYNLSKTSVIQEAWKNNDNKPFLHGWVYDLEDGLIRSQNVMYGGQSDIDDTIYKFDFVKADVDLQPDSQLT